MCFGGKDIDPTQQPIKITQASEAEQAYFSAPSKRKEDKKRPHTDFDDHGVQSTHKNEKTSTESDKSEPLKPTTVDKKTLRNKYNNSGTGTGRLAALNFDFTATP